MKIKSQRDFAAGLLFLLLGVGFAIGASHDPLGESAAPGPTFFPLLLGVLLALLGSALLFKSLTIETDGGEPLGPIDWRAPAAVVAAVAGFGAVLPWLGLVATVALTGLLVGAAGNGARWRGVLLRSLLLAAAVGLLCGGLFGLALPLWPAQGR